jgi:hypothetical protein
VGVPLMLMRPVPLPVMFRPGMALLMLLTASVTLPVPPEALILVVSDVESVGRQDAGAESQTA